jgi:hypothetical protein
MLRTLRARTPSCFHRGEQELVVVSTGRSGSPNYPRHAPYWPIADETIEIDNKFYQGSSD